MPQFQLRPEWGQRNPVSRKFSYFAGEGTIVSGSDPITEGIAAPRGPGWRNRLALIATAVLVPVLLLGIVEAGLRVFGVGNPANVTRPCTDHGHPAFCDNQFFTAAYFPPGMLRTPRPYAIPATKEPGTYRIFVLGESAAWGDPDPTYAFSRYLEVMLRQRFPSMKFEVINASITAVNSHVLLPVARELAQHQPDLFIVYAGNNEVVGPYGPGTVLTPAALSLPGIRARIFVNSTRLGQLVAKLSSAGRQRPQEWHGMEMFLERQVRANSPQMKPVYENFAANLRDIVAAARRSGAQVLVSTVAMNLKDCAPFASMHREGLKEEELRSWHSSVQQGEAAENAGSYSDALKQYLAAAEIDAQYAELQFRIARCLSALGDFAAAKERFVRSRDLDTLRFRADSGLNEAIRSVSAGAGQGVELVDTEAIFAQESPHGIPGSELFYEHVHMNPAGNYLIARGLFSRIANLLPSGLPHSSSDAVPTEQECDRLLALTPYDRSRVAGLVLRKLEHPPFMNQLNHSGQVAKMKQAAETSSEYADTVAAYGWAIAQNPQDRLLHLNYGFFLHRYAPAASAQELRMALPYDNAPVLCNWRKFD